MSDTSGSSSRTTTRMFRAGVVSSLRAQPDIEVVGEAEDAAGALALCRASTCPTSRLLDITMPGGGLDAARDITAACPATRVVMLTVSEDEDDLLAAMKAGASGYVLKGAGASELAGRHSLGVRRRGVRRAGARLGTAARDVASALEPARRAHAREREVLELVAEGLSNQEIGDRLGLAEKTIKHYMTNILGKLQVRSRVEAALLAYREGLAPPVDVER